MTAGNHGDPAGSRRVILIGQHLIKRGPVTGDGETLEVEAGEVIEASFADQGQRQGVSVLGLTPVATPQVAA